MAVSTFAIEVVEKLGAEITESLAKVLTDPGYVKVKLVV
jgi:hypothetical protein